jgi:hypothetical protein
MNESPPTNGNGGLSAAGPGNNNDQPLLDSAAVVNRKLVKSDRHRGLAFYAVLERRNRVRYEIVSQSKTWHFPLFFSADGKWDRLIAAKEIGRER